MSALPPKADIGTGPYHDEIIAWLAANDRRIAQRRVRRTKRALMRLT
jgi:hypothetical protein